LVTGKWMSMEHLWNDTNKDGPTYSEKNLSQRHLYIINPIQTGLGLNLGLRGERPATNRLSHGTPCYKEDEIL
jgi:hypothetical protein